MICCILDGLTLLPKDFPCIMGSDGYAYDVSEFKVKHQAIYFMLEQESEEGFTILSGLIKRRAAGSVQLYVYRKPT